MNENLVGLGLALDLKAVAFKQIYWDKEKPYKIQLNCAIKISNDLC